MIGAKKFFLGGLVVSQLVGFGGTGICGAMGPGENLVYVGNNNTMYGAGYNGNCNFVQGGNNNYPQIIVVKGKGKKGAKKSSESVFTMKKALIVAAIGGAGYWGYKKWNSMTPEQQAKVLQWIEYGSDKLYRGAYVVNSARGFF